MSSSGDGSESDASDSDEGCSVGHQEKLRLRILLHLVRSMANSKPRVVRTPIRSRCVRLVRIWRHGEEQKTVSSAMRRGVLRWNEGILLGKGARRMEKKCRLASIGLFL